MVRIKGIIVPVHWDDEGNVDRLGIETFDEDFYHIAAETKGMRELKRLQQKEVELVGTIGENAAGKSIRVTNYGPIELRPTGAPPATSRPNVSLH